MLTQSDRPAQPDIPTKIAYVLKMYPRFSETFILNEILELERQGVQVHIFSLKKPDDGRFHADLARVKAPVTYVPEQLRVAPEAFLLAHREVASWNSARYRRLLWRTLGRRRGGALRRLSQAAYIAPILRREGITHVHAHFASSATSVASYLHRLAGFSYSFTAHAKDIYHDDVNPRTVARKIEASRFTVTVSDYNRAFLGELGAAERLARIYNGLDLEQFRLNGTRQDDPPLVLGVGRLVEKKGFDDLVRACAILRDSGLDFRCRIVGKGDQAPMLRTLIDSLDLADRVELAGPLPREALLGLYPRASAFAAPCVVAADGNRDGLPTVLIEAMALGVPVVATPVTGIPELVEHAHTGLLVPERDPAALAAAIHRLLVDREAAAQMAAAARLRVEREFDLRTNVAALRERFVEAAMNPDPALQPGLRHQDMPIQDINPVHPVHATHAASGHPQELAA